MTTIEAATEAFVLEIIDICNRLKQQAKALGDANLASTFAILELLKSQALTKPLALHEVQELLDYTAVIDEQLETIAMDAELQAA